MMTKWKDKAKAFVVRRWMYLTAGFVALLLFMTIFGENSTVV